MMFVFEVRESINKMHSRGPPSSRRDPLTLPWGPDPPFWFELMEYSQRKTLLELAKDHRGSDVKEVMVEARLLAEQAAEFVTWKKYIDMKLTKWKVQKVCQVKVREKKGNKIKERVVGTLQVGAIVWSDDVTNISLRGGVRELI